MASKEDDYTKYRTVGSIPYSVDDKIGKRDLIKVTGTTTIASYATVSGTVLWS